MNLDQLAALLLQRLEAQKPRALLIGEAPEPESRYQYVREAPYEAVVLGQLPPGALLRMPDDPVCRALLAGVPVYLWPQRYPRDHARLLCRELAAAEQRLLRLGVRRVPAETRLITADQARQMSRAGAQPGPGSRLTPLAKDILEGKAP